MRRAGVALLLILVTVIPVAESATSGSRYDASGNVRMVGMMRLGWTPSDDYQGWPIYMHEMAFRRRLIVATVQGDHAPTRPPGDLGESGLATFHIDRTTNTVQQVGSFKCHSLGDITLWGDIVTQGSVRSSEAAASGARGCDRNGLRIIDISNPRKPRSAGFVPIPCGVLDHAIVPTGSRVYVYAPSTCDEQVENPFNAGVTSDMSVIRIDLKNPAESEVVGIADLLPLNGCSEVAVNLERDLVVCVGDTRFGLLDISDPAAPKIIEGSVTATGAVVVSPMLTWSGSRLVVGDEASLSEDTGGYSRVLIYDVEDVTGPTQVGTWTVPNGAGNDQKIYSIVPVPMRDGRDVIAIAHANRGFWLVDVSDVNDPEEIAYVVPTLEAVTPDPEDPKDPFGSDVVSAYWYNGRFYMTDMDQLRTLRVRGFNRRTVHFFRGSLNSQTLIRSFI